MKKEQVEVEEKAIRYIAKAADGSMRDALSLLDQCIAFYLGQKLTYDHVLEVLGAVDTDVFSRLLRQIISQDVGKVLATVEELVMQGRELTQLAADFTWYLRNLLLVKTSDNMEDVLDVSTENLAQLKEEAQMIESGVLLRYIRIFSELTNQLKYATQKKSASGSNTDQALQNRRWRVRRQSSGPDPCTGKTGRRRKFCSCAAAGEGCLRKW